MYADNTVIVSDSEQGMKQALIALDSYCNDCRLEVNCSRVVVVVVVVVEEWFKLVIMTLHLVGKL